jgi:biopolymer transport protein ExbD
MPQRRNRKDSGIDMSSMMDIIFILLIFVMISVSFQKKFSHLELNLPSIGQGQIAEEIDVELSVFENGQIFLNKKEVKLSNLKVEMEIHKEKNLSLNIEKKVPYETFIEISEILKSIGIHKVQLGLKLNK